MRRQAPHTENHDPHSVYSSASLCPPTTRRDGETVCSVYNVERERECIWHLPLPGTRGRHKANTREMHKLCIVAFRQNPESRRHMTQPLSLMWHHSACRALGTWTSDGEKSETTVVCKGAKIRPERCELKPPLISLLIRSKRYPSLAPMAQSVFVSGVWLRT